MKAMLLNSETQVLWQAFGKQTLKLKTVWF